MPKNTNYKKLASGHTASRCSYCGVWVVFLLNKNGKKVPCHDSGLVENDVKYDEDRHVNHFARCDGQGIRAAERKALTYCLMTPKCTEKTPKELVVCGTHFAMCGDADISDPKERREDKYNLRRLQRLLGVFGNPFKGDSSELDIGPDGIDPNDEAALLAAIVRVEILKTNQVRMTAHNERKARDRDRRKEQN